MRKALKLEAAEDRRDEMQLNEVQRVSTSIMTRKFYINVVTALKA